MTQCLQMSAAMGLTSGFIASKSLTASWSHQQLSAGLWCARNKSLFLGCHFCRSIPVDQPITTKLMIQNPSAVFGTISPELSILIPFSQSVSQTVSQPILPGDLSMKCIDWLLNKSWQMSEHNNHIESKSNLARNEGQNTRTLWMFGCLFDQQLD